MTLWTLGAAALVWPAAAAEMSSAYTDLDTAKDCTTASASDDGTGAASLICPGWKGYPMLVSEDDDRQSVYYGFSASGQQPVWGKLRPVQLCRVENRMAASAGRQWGSDPDSDDPALVRKRSSGRRKNNRGPGRSEIGQPGGGEGCTVGLVVATGNPQANKTARGIADKSAADFACGTDERILVASGVPVPVFARAAPN